MQQDLAHYEVPLNTLANTATSFNISTPDDLREATILLSQLNQYNDNIQEEKERITKPLNEALKAERSRWKPLETIYTKAIDTLRSQMTVYQTNLINTTKAEEQAIASRIAPGKGNLSLDTAIKKIEALPIVEKEIATEAGLVQFREKPVLKVIDLNLVPRLYLELDEELALKELKNGTIIPGLELEIIQIPVNYR